MADQPVPWLRAQITDRVIGVLSTLLVGLQTEAGQAWTDIGGTAYTVPMMAQYPDEAAFFPSVVVTVNLGHMPGGYALGRIDTDGTQPGQTNTGAPIYGFRSDDTTITLTIAALSDAQRVYLVDVLRSGIQFGYWHNATTGQYVDQVVRLWLAEAGIELKDIGKPRDVPVSADDPRPEGQRFDVAFDLSVNAYVTAIGGLGPSGTISIVQQPTLTTGITIPSHTLTP